MNTNVAQQLAFIVEIDKLKQILRRTSLMDGSRNENSAEHSWHLAMMALVLAEHAPQPINLAHAIQLLLVHDIVEIDAGDTFAFDLQGQATKDVREQAAAKRIFGLLPTEQGQQLLALWEEFEASSSPEAQFALAMDRLEPLLCNTHNGGGTWREHHITRNAVLRRMDPIRTGAPGVWAYASAAIEAACSAGWITPD